ncbi:hypothetical protein PQU92_11295 [Asticcacaulis sp. BYS171W]|uniref:Uncharacterized protein n=1 Tax=Asticcacaulis aquaticus TaxID=2984212 RepID=A0ABT5HUW7_9CAUL|nr:hypothetical protein [Asticcacaulis aquaticus]MDC7683865.1 hypothetical protein [Asticcacaulis aquaticus]
MTNDPKKSEKDEKAARVAAALRANLQRRKAAARKPDQTPPSTNDNVSE